MQSGPNNQQATLLPRPLPPPLTHCVHVGAGDGGVHLVAVVDADLQAAHAAGHGTLWLINAQRTAVGSATPCTRTTRPCPAAGDAHALAVDHLPWLPVPISRSQPCLCHHTGFLGSSMAPYSYPSSRRKQTGLMTPVTNGHAHQICTHICSHTPIDVWCNMTNALHSPPPALQPPPTTQHLLLQLGHQAAGPTKTGGIGGTGRLLCGQYLS